ncbi:MAG: trigger factor, partial [Acidobacteria bacterium]|nr:trigger factor [Acidobacteriota bacterium]
MDEVESETARVVADLKKRARLPGFRPGKAPDSIIRRQFGDEVRHRVMENLIPTHLQKQFEAEGLHVVGRPDITDVHMDPGEPFRFKAEFEVMPDIELGDYKGVTVSYNDPEITDEDIDKRIAELREQKAEYVNIDPRPLEKGDYAAVSLESVAGLEGEPVKRDEMTLELGGSDTLPEFSTNLEGATPGDEKEFDVTYPGDYGQTRLAGKTVRFRAQVKAVRRKELPELNDEFAQDLGDFRNMEELREALRKSIFAQRQYEAQQEAKNKIVDAIVDMHN